MGRAEWVIEVDEDLKTMVASETEMKHWMKRSIYKVPPHITDHKQRALLHFLKRSGKPLEFFVESLHKDLQQLRDCYELLDPMWQDDDHKFMQLMILDGCFMLEILCFDTHTMEDYAETDPIFSNHGKIHIIPFIKRDMLMLENQLPMQLLHSLVAVDSNGTKVIPSLWTHY
ncbi:hypothetical protein Gohar_009939 [Gossypium harknessii]|uniref:Uncharacterized protein n=1 Tax=Gossypium harknessii TaxID=34285 RepID=A0A7J9GPB3_9ROSI|nr:hypothetical protein [Gossypium harknessii]